MVRLDPQDFRIMFDGLLGLPLFFQQNSKVVVGHPRHRNVSCQSDENEESDGKLFRFHKLVIKCPFRAVSTG